MMRNPRAPKRKTGSESKVARLLALRIAKALDQRLDVASFTDPADHR
jgi:hypothetical protein